MTCLKLTSTGGNYHVRSPGAQSAFFSKWSFRELDLSTQESSKWSDLVLTQCESCSGMLAVFFCDISVSHSASGAQWGPLVWLPYEVHQG